MSAQIIRLADYRKPKKKPHKPKCRACRQPGHYFRTCPDDDAYNAMIDRDRAAHEERLRQIEASFEAKRTVTS